ncbi:DUF6660 family protein [Zhouia sp. PK063]|uniref:DUF6660 family protein n=1 Tax=Zhouia sp. PK063 TaxID=3373602 RepID=UPI0037BB0030
MKFVALIFALYILSLHLFSCTDAVVNSNQTETTLTSLSDNNHDHQDVDLCTPFCTCHCCHVHTIDAPIVSVHYFSVHIPTSLYTYSEQIIEEPLYVLLDPPRI